MSDLIGMMIRQRHGKGDVNNDKNITKQKVLSSFGRLDWYDQAKARATLLAARKRAGGIFSTVPLERKVLDTQIIFGSYYFMLRILEYNWLNSEQTKPLRWLKLT